MTTFDEYVRGCTDHVLLNYLRAYYEFGEKASRLSFYPDDIFLAFHNVHFIGTLEAVIDEAGVYPNPDDTEIEIDFDELIYEIFPNEYLQDMIKTTYQVGRLLNYISNRYDKFSVNEKLLGAFVLGLGFEIEEFKDFFKEPVYTNIAHYLN